MYLRLSNRINIDIYKKVLKEFSDLWGVDLHIYGEDIFSYPDLKVLLSYLNTFNFNTVSLNIEKQHLTVDEIDIQLMKEENVNALLIPINKELLNNAGYIRLVKNIANSKTHLEVYSTVNNSNINDIEQVVTYCLNNGIRQYIVDIEKNPLRPSDKIMGEDYKKLVKRILNINEENKSNLFKITIADCPYLITLNNQKMKDMLGGCSGGITTCAIDENGNIILCFPLSEIIIGNIERDSLKQIWNSSKILEELRDRNNIKGNCSKCEYLISCGGCRAEAYFLNKDLFSEDPICWIRNK